MGQDAAWCHRHWSFVICAKPPLRTRSSQHNLSSSSSWEHSALQADSHLVVRLGHPLRHIANVGQGETARRVHHVGRMAILGQEGTTPMTQRRNLNGGEAAMPLGRIRGSLLHIKRRPVQDVGVPVDICSSDGESVRKPCRFHGLPKGGG